MDWGSFANIFVAAIGFGAAGEGIRQYRSFKRRRLELPVHVRNRYFWTDRRIIRAEALLVTLLLLGPWTVILMAVATNNNLYANMLALFTYPAAIYLFMRGLRADHPQ